MAFARKEHRPTRSDRRSQQCEICYCFKSECTKTRHIFSQVWLAKRSALSKNTRTRSRSPGRRMLCRFWFVCWTPLDPGVPTLRCEQLRKGRFGAARADLFATVCESASRRPGSLSPRPATSLPQKEATSFSTIQRWVAAGRLGPWPRASPTPLLAHTFA